MSIHFQKLIDLKKKKFFQIKKSDFKIRDWQTYFDFNHYAIQEIKNGTLDSWFEDYKK